MKQRRKRFLATLSVDTGGWLVVSPRFTNEPVAQTTLRATTFLKSFHAMGYAALNVGEHEMVLPPKTLLKLAKRTRNQLISANIMVKKTGKPVFQPAIMRTVAGLKVGIFGLTSGAPQARGKLFADRGLMVAAPLVAAKAAVTVLRKNGADVVICLSALRKGEVDLLAEKVKGIDIVLGSTSMDLTLQLAKLGGGYFADTYTKGKYQGELVLTPGTNHRSWVAANLKASLAQQAGQLRTQVQELSEQLKTAGKPGSPIELTPASRQLMQRDLVRLRAKLQRVDLELEGNLKAPEGAGRIRATMHPINKEIADDKGVLKIVARYKKKYPSKPGH